MKNLKFAIYASLILMINTATAASLLKISEGINAKGESSSALHTTYFSIKPKVNIPTHVNLMIGQWQNNTCNTNFRAVEYDTNINFTTTISIGQSGLKELVNTYNYTPSCALEHYTNTLTGKSVSISFQLFHNGDEYTAAIPSQHTISLE